MSRDSVCGFCLYGKRLLSPYRPHRQTTSEAEIPIFLSRCEHKLSEFLRIVRGRMSLLTPTAPLVSRVLLIPKARYLNPDL